MDNNRLEYILDELKIENDKKEKLLNSIKNKEYDLDDLLPFETPALSYEYDEGKRHKGKFIIKILESLLEKLDQYTEYFKEENVFGYDLYFTYKSTYYCYSIMVGQGTEESIMIIDKSDYKYYLDLAKEKVVDTQGNIIKNRQVYLCGDMLHKAQFEYRKQQKRELENIKGIEVYNPSSNESINNKKTATKEKLAERIVEQDTKAIEDADIYIIDLPTADAGGRGSITELGQIFQMKREAKTNLEILKRIFQQRINDVAQESLKEEILRQKEIIDKPVFIFSDDIRWSTTDMNDSMDRVPYSFNAYTYGVALYLTNGEGVISWEEVKHRLRKLGEQQ